MNMQKTLNINGIDYNIFYDGYITPDIENLVRSTIMKQYSRATLGTFTCPPSIIQNSGHIITLTATSGTPHFTFNVYIDGAGTPTLVYTGGSSETSHQFTYNFPETAGFSHTYKGEIVNNCGTDSSTCTISIVSAATPTPTPPPCIVPSCSFSVS